MRSEAQSRLTWESTKAHIAAFLWLGLLLLGIGLFTVGYFYSETAPDHPIQKLIYGIGSAVLGGGVFAAILKSLQFTTLFRDELRKVLFADADWLASLQAEQFKTIWKNVITASIKKGAPALTDRIGDHIFNDMIPQASGYSYSNMARRVIIEKYDKQSDSATVLDEYELQIDAHDAAEGIIYNFRLTGEWPDTSETPPFVVEKLLIDGRDHSGDLSQKGSKGSKDYEIFHNIELQGSLSYKVIRNTRRQYRLSTDPVLRMVSTRFTRSLTLSIENRVPTEIATLFYSMSINENLINRQVMADEPNRRVERRDFNTLILPGQGYIIFLAKR